MDPTQNEPDRDRMARLNAEAADKNFHYQNRLVAAVMGWVSPDEILTTEEES